MVCVLTLLYLFLLLFPLAKEINDVVKKILRLKRYLLFLPSMDIKKERENLGMKIGFSFEFLRFSLIFFSSFLLIKQR